MPNLEQRERLRPFCKFAYTSMNTSEADEGYKKYDTAKDSRPEYSADKIIAD